MDFPKLTSLTSDLFRLPPTAQRKPNICSMVNFFPEAKHFLDAVHPSHIVEIGCESGANTVALLEYAQKGNIHLSAVDPVEIDFPFPAAEEKIFSFFQTTSTEFLEQDFNAEVIFLDGDHNYETVFKDLLLLHKYSQKTGIKLVFLHDVSWPWARRDLYYAPERIESPHPNDAQTTVSPYESDTSFCLAPAGYNTAFSEGGKKNGVLTAVEDFLRENGKEWLFWHIPVVYGIGILVCAGNLRENELSQVKCLAEHLLTHRDLLATFELNRVENLCLIQSLQNDIVRAGKTWECDQSYIKQANSQLEELSRQTAACHAELSRQISLCQQSEALCQAKIAELEKTTALLTQETERREQSEALCQTKIAELEKTTALLAQETDRREQSEALCQTKVAELEKTTALLAQETDRREQSEAQCSLLAGELRRNQLLYGVEFWRLEKSLTRSLLPYGKRNAAKVERIEQMLEKREAAVLSLDVFDTILLRDLHSELQRFKEIAQLLHERFPAVSVPDFYYARVLAHRFAYQSKDSVSGCREAHFSAIFRCMSRILNVSLETAEIFKDVELEYETAHLSYNPVIGRLIAKARQCGIPVIAVSDMYWSAEYIQLLLQKVLPEEIRIDRVYSSSDFEVSKASGQLFDHVLQAEKCAPEKMCHLGDNEQADCIVPFIRHGINAVWLPRSCVYNRYCRRQQNKSMKLLYKKGVINGVR